MTRRVATATLLALACSALAACSLLGAPSEEIVRDGWAWPAPAPLPPGAIAVPIDVSPIRAPAGAEVIGCPAAALGPMTPEHRPGRTPPVVYRVEGGEVLVRWPVGFSARLAPNLEIVAPDGKVFARAGETTDGLGGGYVGDAFSVCLGEYGPTRVGASG